MKENTLAAIRSCYHRNWNKQLSPKELDYLLCHAFHISYPQLFTRSRWVVPAELLQGLREMAVRRASGVPLAYLSGRKEFYSLEFEVSTATLTPRPETEMLVDFAVNHASQGARLLELGCGCGAVAIAIARHRPDLNITACDISTEALRVAGRNVRKHDVRVRLVKSNWFGALRRRRAFHCVVANVPYLRPGEARDGDITIRHEPKLALLAGENGLASLRQVLEEAPLYLVNGGLIALEHAPWQRFPVAAMAKRTGFRNLRCNKDYAGLSRITVGKIGGKKPWSHPRSGV